MIRAVLALLLLAGPALARESAPVRSERAVATLVSDADAADPGRPLRLALRLRIAPGWHTYWSNPGDAGVPPELTLSLPPGASTGPIAFPVPARLPEGPLMTYGYTGEVLLPVTVTGFRGGAIEARASWLVCQRVCVPEEGSFTLDLPPGPAAPSAEAPLFAAADARAPRPSPFAARIAPGGTLSVSGAGLSRESVRDAWFLPAEAGTVEAAAPQPASVREGEVSLFLRPGDRFAPDKPLDGVLVLRDPAGAETALLVSATPGPAPAAAVPAARALLFALLGGLVLNLMPCVFPVLAMKAVAVARLSGAARGAVRAEALFYVAGVLVAFAAVGGALLLLRAAGGAAGWGFQFQSPVFVAAAAWLLFAVGLNLSGVFAVAGPAGAGQSLAGRGGHAGSFFTGLLAVLVATPCTAPFMGAAVAAALAAPAAFTILVFLFMGLGLAAPYVLLAAAPGLARLLPRPGPWMGVLRGALAFPMYAAAAWLLWVLSQQAGPDGVLLAAAGLVLLGLAAWSFGLAQGGEQGSGRRVGRTVAVLAVAAALALLPGLASTAAPAATAETADAEAFTPERLAALRAAGRPVFVNMTAAWCVTCLVNERVALAPEAVRRAFAERRVAYLKGDWTRQDPVISAFLRDHGRDGVPLYVLFPPGGAPPAVLPQVLTEGAVLRALDRLGG